MHAERMGVITVPDSAAYQGQATPVRGLWNSTPAEGDKFLSFPIQWVTQTAGKTAVQIDTAGNSPVAISQMVAASVDNTRCGADVTLIFPDTGTALRVSAFEQIISPIFSNGTTFYVSAPNCATGDITIVNVHNSMPPPIAAPVAIAQQTGGIINTPVGAGFTVPLVAAPASGTVEGFSVALSGIAAGPESVALSLVDGAAHVLWAQWIEADTGNIDVVVALAPVRLRFYNGLNFVGVGAMPNAGASANVYYTTP